MRVRCFAGLSIMVFACALTIGQSQNQQFALRDGDCVVFYGDSITEQKLYTSDVEEFVLTRFPERKVTFIHSGVGGDTVSGGLAGPVGLRLERDVFAYHPSVVTIMLGMNDGYFGFSRTYDPAIFETYANGYRRLTDSIQSKVPGVSLMLIKPSPFDDVTRDAKSGTGYNVILQRFGGFVEDLATQKHTGLADMYTPVLQLLNRVKALDPVMSITLIPDLVHPGAGVQWIMAETLLKAWGAPALVTSVTLDAAKSTALETLNAQVTQLQKNKDTLSWVESDQALPLPLPTRNSDPFVDLAVGASDLIEMLDQETLRISGLAPGSYQLSVDGKLVGVFSADQLASGLNLALMETPMLQQARLVAFDTEKKNKIDETRFGLIRQLRDQISEEAASKLLASRDRAVKQQHIDAQPVPHRYVLAQIAK
jgi:lysophospholipase L1-like esterase